MENPGGTEPAFRSGPGSERRTTNSGVAGLTASVSPTVRLSQLQYAVPFVIRDFKLEDFETLWLIDQECFPIGIAYSRQELKLYMRRRGSVTLVAEDSSGAAIGGFIVAHAGPGDTSLRSMWSRRRAGRELDHCSCGP